MVFRNIIPYIRKFGKHPATGAQLKQEDLIALTFHKNSEGYYLFHLEFMNSDPLCFEIGATLAVLDMYNPLEYCPC